MAPKNRLDSPASNGIPILWRKVNHQNRISKSKSEYSICLRHHRLSVRLPVCSSVHMYICPSHHLDICPSHRLYCPSSRLTVHLSFPCLITALLFELFLVVVETSETEHRGEEEISHHVGLHLDLAHHFPVHGSRQGRQARIPLENGKAES